MAKVKISEFSTTAGNNTDINSINIAEGCSPSGINDAIRELMRQLKEFQTGGAGDSVNSGGDFSVATNKFTVASASGNTSVAGTLGVTGAATLSSTLAVTGTTTLTGALLANGNATLGDASGDTVTIKGTPTLEVNPTLSGGTANGVLYLNGSKVATSGSALTFDGSSLAVTLGSTTTPSVRLYYNGSSQYGMHSMNANGDYVVESPALNGVTSGYLYLKGNAAMLFGTAGSEAMRLTSTGLGIGLTSVTSGYKLEAQNGASGTGIRASNSGGGYITIEAESNATSNGVLRWTNDIKFIEGSTERMRLSSGNLGIGTSSPGTKLTIAQNGGSNNQYIQLVDTQTSGVTWQIANYATNTIGMFGLYNATAGAYRLLLSGDGNLGLGVTPRTWSAGAISIDIGAYSSDYFRSAGFVGKASNAYYNSGWLYTSTNRATRYEMSVGDGSHAWYNAASGTAGDAISFTQAMTLDASGRLLIGATSGSRKLEVHTANGTETAILLNQSGIGAATLFVPASTNALAFGVFSGGSGLVEERARIDSSGNLMAGRTSALAGARISAETSTGSPTFASYGPTTGTEYAFDFVNPNGIVGSITTNGSATAFNTSSDYRLKDNPQPLNGSGAFIDALKPKTWNWKVDGSVGVGFIAHEVQEVSPGSVVGEKDGEQMQAMEYGSAEFIANIIAEIQSLRARVASLES